MNAATIAQLNYQDTRDLPRDQVLALYAAVGWSSAEKPDELMAALAGSDAVVTAWDGDRLVGLANAITDGALVVYYPHLLVHPDYQRRGVGREIMRRVTEPYDGFHQQAILADANAASFYEKCGFTRPSSVRAMWIYQGNDHNESRPWAGAMGEAAHRLIHRTGRRWAVVLWAAQALVTIAAVLAAVVEIESILGTGPVTSLLGLALALVARPLRSWPVFFYGISAPLVWAICALLIAVFDWRPGEAHAPIATILAIYALLAAPLALVALRHILHGRVPPRPIVLRYSLKSLLYVMTALCVLLVLIRAIVQSQDEEAVIFGLFALVALSLAGVAGWFVWTGRRHSGRFGRPAIAADLDVDAMVQRIIATGRFASEREVLEAGLQLLEREVQHRQEVEERGSALGAAEPLDATQVDR